MSPRMSASGTPLRPIPPLLRWTGRGLGWFLAVGLVVLRAVGGDPSVLLAACLLAAFTWCVALETHRWLPTQNTVAAAVQVSVIGSLVLVVRGRISESMATLNLLIWFSHILAARGLIRYLLRPWRGASGYGIAVLAGTTLVSGGSVALSQTCVNQGPSMGEWLIQTAGLGLAVLAASVWLLVKKPVVEIPNPRPAVLGAVLIAVQATTLVCLGRRGIGALVGIAAAAVMLGILTVHRSLRKAEGSA